MAQTAGLRRTGEWSACVECSEARVIRQTVPKATGTRADRRAGRIFVDLAGLFSEDTLAGNMYAMICVNDFSRCKIVAFVARKGDATAMLRAIIAKYFTPTSLKIGVTRIGNGGEFEGKFQSLFAEYSIKQERTPPHTP